MKPARLFPILFLSLLGLSTCTYTGQQQRSAAPPPSRAESPPAVTEQAPVPETPAVTPTAPSSPPVSGEQPAVSPPVQPATVVAQAAPGPLPAPGPTAATPPPSLAQAAQFQHAPFADEMCDSCHESEKPSATDLFDEPPDLCYNCHDEFAKKFVHAPAGLGACTLCHNPHQSSYPFFLNQKIPDLCYQCHDRMQKIMTNPRHVKHPPATDQCVACHNPHGSDVSNKFLQADLKTLCQECHLRNKVPMQKYITTVTHKHKPVVEDGSCAQCHSPHASPFEFHLRAEPMDLCLQCHNREVTAYDSRVLANMAVLLQKNPDHHGPIREKRCTACHDPHGSNYFRILKHNYPQTFYTETFSLDNYQLCFSCHEPTLLRDRETTTLTNFRDGKRNLHFLHVHRPQKGRTCRACHETHASTHPKHIRDAVPFGKIGWPLALRYRVEYADINTGEPCNAPSATCVKTGGSCVGCHSRKHYNYRKTE